MTGSGVAARHLHVMLVLFSVFAVCRAQAATKTETATPGGPLVIEQLDDNTLGSDFRLTLAGRTVLHTQESGDRSPFPDFPKPEVIRYFAEHIGSFDAVAVFQQFSWGNACNGGPVWFLGIHRDGTYQRSEPIDACGGPSPQVALDHGVIHIILGPAEEWTYAGHQPKRIR